MQENGIVRLKTTSQQSEVSLSSAPNDYTCTDVIISYDYYKGEWIVSGGGYWNNGNWMKDKDGVWIGYTGETKLLGTPDAFGIAFEMQDKIVCTYGGVGSTYKFIGYNFGSSVRYNSSFSSYHGYARSFYVHTWDKAKIDSINFGVSGKQFGIEFSISNGVSANKIFSNKDIIF